VQGIRAPTPSCNRRQVNDLAPTERLAIIAAFRFRDLCDHLLGGFLHGEKDCSLVDPLHIIPLRFGHLQECRFVGNARIIDQDVQPTKLCHDLRDHVPHPGQVADVDGIGQRFGAERRQIGGRLIDHVRVDLCDNDMRSFAGELLADCEANAPACASDDSDPTFQTLTASGRHLGLPLPVASP